MRAICDGETIKYRPQLLVCDNIPLNKTVARENLEIFCKIATDYSIEYVLTYGSCLGAVREKDFIAHDEDIDIGMLREDFNKTFHCLDEFFHQGFELVRYDDRGQFSISRKGEYIDIMAFDEYKEGVMIACDMYITPTQYITEKREIDFLGLKVKVPQDYEGAMEYEYGSTWMTPIKYESAESAVLFAKAKGLVKVLLPKKIRMLLWKKTAKATRDKYEQKYQKYLAKSEKNQENR